MEPPVRQLRDVADPRPAVEPGFARTVEQGRVRRLQRRRSRLDFLVRKRLVLKTESHHPHRDLEPRIQRAQRAILVSI